MAKLSGLFILDESTRDLVYGPAELVAIERHVRWVAPPHTCQSIQDDLNVLNEVEVIFSGWTPPSFDDAFMERAPRLKVIFYAGGPLAPAAAMRRGVLVTTAHNANSRPVAEYTLATILFSLKHGWRLAREVRSQRRCVDRNTVPGCYRSTVGLVGVGAVSRILLKLLKPFDLQVLAYDPFLDSSDAAALGVERVPLEELFSRSDIVSLHPSLNDASRGMIRGHHLESMRPGATLINTSRGGVICEAEMIAVAQHRPDLQFVLDVTDPEPPVPDSPLYTLGNVVVTPHIAGSAGGECRRLGQTMVAELHRYVEGQPLQWSEKPPSPQMRIRPVTLTRERVPARTAPLHG
jgi:phosphoglycerate dehydrogenase-like enzyme